MVRKLMQNKYLIDYFPLHNDWFRNGKMRFYPGDEGEKGICLAAEKEAAYDEDEKAEAKKGLEMKWKYRCCNPFYNPTNKIRSYFGEKIAL